MSPRRSKRKREHDPYSEDGKWDRVNAQIQEIGDFMSIDHIKEEPSKTFMVENDIQTHMCVWSDGWLYNPNDCKLNPNNDLDGFADIKGVRALAVRKTSLNFGNTGVCRLVCLCILGALKTTRGRDDMLTMCGPDFVTKYAKGNVKQIIKRIFV